MSQRYHKEAPCGLCRFYGQSSHVCRECEIRKISENLETLAHAALWEHDHKYRSDSEEEVRTCAHCEHAITLDTRYHAAQYAEDVCCWLDAENLGDDDEFPNHSPCEPCGKWERATDKGR